MKHVKTYGQLFESGQKLTDEQIEFLIRHVTGSWKLNRETGLVDVNGGFHCGASSLKSLLDIQFGDVSGNFNISDNRLTSLKGSPKTVSGSFVYGNLTLSDDQWNIIGWLKASLKSKDAAKLLLPLITEPELDDWVLKNPLDLDLLDEFPKLKRGVLKRTGLRDISKLASLKRRGLI